MARFQQTLTLNKPDDFVQFIMNDFLQKNGFSMNKWKGQPAYRAGDGFVEAYKYLTWSYANGTFQLEAWLKGSFGKEMNLDGFVAALVKKPYKNSLMQLFEVLKQPLPDQGQNPNVNGLGGQSQAGPVPNAIPVHTVDNHGAAVGALVLGILSIPGGFFIPLIGILLGCIGFPLARMGQGSSKAGLAKAGKVCCIVGMALAAAMWILNIVLSVAVLPL